MHHRIIERLSGLLVVLLAMPSSAPATGWATEKVSAGAVEIGSVNLTPWRSGVLVSGRVERTFGYGYLSDSEWDLRIDVLDARRRVTSSVVTTYSPHSLPMAYHGIMGGGMYSVFIQPAPLAGSTLRVSAQRKPTG